jgi:Protein of unknown function (DUF3108)
MQSVRPPIRHHTVRTAMLAVALLAATPAGDAVAQDSTSRSPFSIGEELVYRATFSHLPVGTARMRVAGIESVRGRPAYHLVFTIDGGIIGYRVHDRYDSWVDTATHASLRFAQSISEGHYKKERTYEIYPDRAQYQEAGDTAEASVHNPLDDGSFIYAVRGAAVRVGETQRFDRYFKPDRNPVVLTGLTRDTVTVGAGTFATVVVRPSIRAKGMFSEDGDARIWFTDDDARYPVKIATKFSKFSLTLTLASVTPGVTGELAQRVAAAGK